MAQIGHTTPNLTLAIYARQMDRRDGEPERPKALVEAHEWTAAAQRPPRRTLLQRPRMVEPASKLGLLAGVAQLVERLSCKQSESARLPWLGVRWSGPGAFRRFLPVCRYPICYPPVRTCGLSPGCDASAAWMIAGAAPTTAARRSMTGIAAPGGRKKSILARHRLPPHTRECTCAQRVSKAPACARHLGANGCRPASVPPIGSATTREHNGSNVLPNRAIADSAQRYTHNHAASGSRDQGARVTC